MVLISESHVFISWMHVFRNADTGFGTNPNIDANSRGILNPKSLHISRNLCQLLENIPLMFTSCFSSFAASSFTCKLKSLRLCGMILDYPRHASKITSIISRQPWQRRVIADISSLGSLFSEDRKMF